MYLRLCNNGVGVQPEDEPFLFEKGFTGSYPNRQKATGMGLYLVRKYGQKLCIGLRLSRELPYENGFGIELVFARQQQKSARCKDVLLPSHLRKG